MSNIDKRAQKELYTKVEQQAHSLRGNSREYQAVTGMCPVNVIEMQAQKIQALLDELEAKDKQIAELEAPDLNGRFPLPKDSSQGWKIDPEFISKIQDAIGYDEECQCWEGSPSMEMVEAVLIAAAAIKLHERG